MTVCLFLRPGDLWVCSGLGEGCWMALSRLPLSVSRHWSLWHEDPPAACGAVTARGRRP